jgi:hypothetical protein
VEEGKHCPYSQRLLIRTALHLNSKMTAETETGGFDFDSDVVYET